MKLYAVAEVSHDNKEILGYWNRQFESIEQKLSLFCFEDNLKLINGVCNRLGQDYNKDSKYFTVVEFELSSPTILLDIATRNYDATVDRPRS